MYSIRRLHLLSLSAPDKKGRLAFQRLFAISLLALALIGFHLGTTPVMAQDISTPLDEPQ